MFVCPKCGNKDQRYIGEDKNKNNYCRLCLSFNGEKAKVNDNLKNEEVRPYLTYSLSAKQKEISDQVTKAFINKKNSLIYAVCGAGKTELVYQVIAYALSNKMQVGFTIPRKDVVIELEKRIQEVFCNNKVVGVYQNHNKDLIGDIIVLTTHQLYRYPDYFDLLIIDETDAFPFRDNYLLNFFFTSAVKGNYIMLSATPTEEMFARIKKENGCFFKLTKRYHNHPLIVPKVVIKQYFKINYLLKKIKEFQKEVKPLLIFVPTKDQSEELYKVIKNLVKGGNYVHSEKKDRNQIVDDFKKGKYLFLITTSILERGITIKNLQVIVYNAHHMIFDANTLIQISGRVGRKIDSWDGEVIFLTNKETEEIRKAIEKIKKDNHENFL